MSSYVVDISRPDHSFYTTVVKYMEDSSRDFELVESLHGSLILAARIKPGANQTARDSASNPTPSGVTCIYLTGPHAGSVITYSSILDGPSVREFEGSVKIMCNAQ